MYRLLKIRCVAINNKYATSFQTSLQPSTKVCSFCSVYHPKIPKLKLSNLECRHQSTTFNTAVLNTPIPKKTKRKSQRYGELLEVSETLTSNRKALIQNLNAAELSILVDQHDITLDKLHKIRKKLNKKKNKESKNLEIPKELMIPEKSGIISLSDAEKIQIGYDAEDHSSVIEDLQTFGILDHTGLVKNSALLQTLEDDVHSDDTLLENSNDKSHKISAELQKAKQKELETEKVEEYVVVKTNASLSHDLCAFLRVCLSCNMREGAFRSLMHYRTNVKNSRPVQILDICVYNLMLHAYAALPNIQRIKDLLRVIKEDSVKPSPQTYAAVFEAFGRLRKPRKEINFLNTIRSEMEENGITFDDVIKIPKYILDQRKHVIKTIELLQPDFHRTVNVNTYLYNCHLLNKIDPTVQSANPSPAENLFTQSELEQRFAEQLSSEVQGEVTIQSIENIDTLKPSVDISRQITSELEKSWEKTALKAFERNMKALKYRERVPLNRTMTLYPYLCVFKKEDYVNAILDEVKRLVTGSETFSPSLYSLYHTLGARLNNKYEILEKQRAGVVEKIEEVYLKYCDWYLNRNDSVNSRIAWMTIAQEAEKAGASLDNEDVTWPFVVRYNLGKFLYDIIFKDLKIDINCINRRKNQEHYLPAFYALYRSKGKRMKEEIKPHPILSKLYHASHPGTINFDVSLLPSVCPPKPWNAVRNGGYLVAKSNIVRVPFDFPQQWDRLESAPPQQLWPALDTLNQLASIPWSVNHTVLDIVIKVFRDGGSPKLNVHPPCSALPRVPRPDPNCEKKEAINIMKARAEFQRRKGEMYSLWCDLLYRLSLANHFRDKIFWLPHNMDFRGRVYPIPPHLNHIGSDLARSLLVFALGKPLGPGGLDWLKIHTINLTGFKKRDPISERLKYAEDNMDKILDSAENPLTGKMWWSTSDEPWQTLASCIEISKALKSDNPEEYICHFPIHQDGSCNGLQHYAALGRDRNGAESVNLYPFETPQDVYSSIAAMVEEMRERDAAAGVDVASILEGFVKRKVIKQTVMTTVYGVTRFGARLQIARQLKDADDFPQNYVWQASMYLVNKTFDSLRTMFESAREIQDWLTECAKAISTSRNQHVEWVTPLGLPIIQPYSKDKIAGSKKDLDNKPNTIKQKNAFPPNFIHSLDSSHMMLTSLHCEHEGLTFMSVHDCYWTHPCTVEKMNQICREQFVALHSEPLLENLSQFLLDKYGFTEQELRDSLSPIQMNRRKLNYTLAQVPKKGEFKLEGVLKSTYFFS